MLSPSDGLRNALGAAQRALAALGPRPEGDPAGIRQLAAAVRAEAEAAASAGSAAAAIPGSLVFSGPAATEFRGHANDVTTVINGAARRLAHLATELQTRAAKIQREQDEYDRSRKALEGRVRDIAARLSAAD